MAGLRLRAKRSPGLRRVLFLAQNQLALLRPNCVVARAENQAKYSISAMVRVKNDAPFIREWLAHYVGLGVEHFYVYDNGSDDDTVGVINDLVEKGIVTLIDFPVVPITPACVFHFFENYAFESDWCCFFDSDEFLMMPRGMDIHALLEACPKAPAVAVNWRYMGSGWFKKLPAGLMTEHLVHGDANLDSHIKVIARTRDVRRFRNSHNFYYKRGRLARTFDGSRVYASFCAVRASNLWLAHYVYRGEENYLYKARQRPPEGTASARRVEYSAREYERHNEIVVPPDQTVLARTNQQLAAWREDSSG